MKKIKKIIIKEINNISFPDHWLEEGIEKPNKLSENNTIKVCCILYKYFRLPDYITVTKENGLFIKYSLNDSYIVIVECYNDGEIGLLINDNITKKIVYNEDILDFNFSNFITKIEEIIKKEEYKNE